MPATTDKIEKETVIEALPARVWRALADPAEFGTWFGVRIDGEFTPGARVVGTITTPGYEHLTFEMVIEEMEEERLFAYRWHPYAIDPDVDYSTEPMTRVEIRLEASGSSATRLKIVESGFDQIPAARRAEAFRMNDGGWTEQLKNIVRHVTTQ